MFSNINRLWHHKLRYFLGQRLHALIESLTHHSSEKLRLKLNGFQIWVHKTCHDQNSSHFILKLICVKSEFFQTFHCRNDTTQSFYLSIWQLLVVDSKFILLEIILKLNWSRVEIHTKRLVSKLDMFEIREKFLFFKLSLNLFVDHLFNVGEFSFKLFFQQMERSLVFS